MYFLKKVMVLSVMIIHLKFEDNDQEGTTNKLKVMIEPINFLNIRIHDTYFQDQNEKDISILLDRDLPL